MKYEYLDEGKVILVKNLKFEDGTLDHAWNKGRPCVILFSDDEYEYILPIKSEIKKEYFDKFYINEKSFLYLNDSGYIENTLINFIGSSKNCRIKSKMKKDISGYINLGHIFKIPIAFRNEIGKLDYDTYLSVIDKLHKVQKTKNNDELKERAYNAR